MDLLIEGTAWGMGDQVWQLPYVRALAPKYGRVFMMTPWPQLYHFIPNLVFLHPDDEGSKFSGWDYFREQIDLSSNLFVRRDDIRQLLEAAAKTRFGAGAAQGMTDIQRICPSMSPSTTMDITISLKDEWIAAVADWLRRNAPQPRVLIHPPRNRPGILYARDPVPRYFKRILDRHRKHVSFFDVARVADNVEPAPELEGVPVLDTRGAPGAFWAAVAAADAVICSPAHALPLALAFKRPTLALFGGCHWPNLLIDPRIQHLDYFAVAPEPFCGCGQTMHDCHKAIAPERIDSAMDSLLSAMDGHKWPPSFMAAASSSTQASTS
jgi:hypothetical protein